MEKPAIDYPSQEGAECPFPFYAWARSHPVCPVGGRDVHFISRYEEVIFAADHPEIFSSVGRQIEDSNLPVPKTAAGLDVRVAVATDPPEHAEHRKLIFPFFSPTAIKGYESMIRKHVNDLIDTFIARGECEFIEEFAAQLPARVIGSIFGLPDRLTDLLGEWGQIEASGAYFMSPARREKQSEITESMMRFVTQILEERIANPGLDGLSELIRRQIERDGILEFPYLRLQTFLLLNGGVITTAHLIGSTMTLLVENPETLRRVQSDNTLIRKVLDETLRVESPVQWVPRRVASDVVLGGVKLIAGTHVLLGWASGNRDPAAFNDPDLFDIDRKSKNAQLGFGRGTHFCIGRSLALMEATAALEEIFRRVRNIRKKQDGPINHIDSPSFRGVQRLDLLFEHA